jgi:S1-C subfamily serine protease
VRPYRTGGDVITSIDGRPVQDPDDLSRAVALLDPGTTVTVEAWRDGERREVKVRLGERPLQRLQSPG